MKPLKPKNFLLLSFIFLMSCNSNLKYHYSINDFRVALQPALTNIVTNGIVEDDSSSQFLSINATERELEQLSYSEHPVLRAIALRLRTKKDTVDNFAIVMNHLDDTAVVPVDHGEFGIDFYMVTDDLIDNSIWKTQKEKDITIDSVIGKHNYLQSAYEKLSFLPTSQKYYPYVRSMVLEKKDEYLDRHTFWMLEEAVYSLAKYRKKEDTSLIHEILISNLSRLTATSFTLISEYPNTSYLDVLDEYSDRTIYSVIREKRSYDAAEAFINSVAAYRQPKSAQILERVLNPNRLYTIPADIEYIKKAVASAVWNNKCGAFVNLMAQVKPYLSKVDTTSFILPIEESHIVVPRKIRW